MKMVSMLIELSQHARCEIYEMIMASGDPNTGSKSTNPFLLLFVTCSELILFPDQIL